MFYGDSGHVFHVSKSGDDANGGLAQQYPISLANDSKLTISSAVSAASDGDTIVIWPGTYAEQVDLQAAVKAVNLVGVQREKCIISQNTVDPAVLLYAGSRMENLRVEQSGSGMVVNGSQQDNCRVINCGIVGGDAAIDGLYFSGADKIVVKDCYIKAAYDALYITKEALVENCVIVTNGLASGSGIARAIAVGSSPDYVIIRDSIIIAQPSYEKKTGKFAELYQSERDLYCINNGGEVILENCMLLADGHRPEGAHADAYSNGHSYCTSGINRLVAKNCIFKAWTDQNVADRIAYGIMARSASLINSIINTSAEGDGGTAYDLYNTISSTVCLVATRYDSSKVHSNVTLHALPDDTGRLDRAAKTLLNKAVQTKTTGAINYYDDDGQAIILTHTPADGASTIIREPS